MMPAVVVQKVAAEMKKYVVIYVQEKKEKGGIAASGYIQDKYQGKLPIMKEGKGFCFGK